MTDELKYILLGLVQGIAEFFPISSSGHTSLLSIIFKIAEKQPLLFMITVHFATTLSTIAVYRHKIMNIITETLIKKNPSQISFAIKLIISAVPVVIMGLLFKTHVNNLFSNSNHIVSYMLILTSLILLISKYAQKRDGQITYKAAILMGVAQSIAIVPGISRSGATITTALFCGVDRKKAAEFSFLMVLLPIFGMTFIEIIELSKINNLNLLPDELKGLLLAFISALLSGWIACKYMIIIVQKNHLNYFGYYCLTIGLVSLFFI